MKEGILQTPAAYTLATLLTDIGSVFSTAISWVGDVAETIVSNPLLLIGCIIGFVGIGIGLFKRLMRV